MENLPINLVFYISCFLPIKSIYHFGLSCKKMSKVLENERLWEIVALNQFGKENLLHFNFKAKWKDLVKTGLFQWDTISPVSKLFRVKKIIVFFKHIFLLQ